MFSWTVKAEGGRAEDGRGRKPSAIMPERWTCSASKKADHTGMWSFCGIENAKRGKPVVQENAAQRAGGWLTRGVATKRRIRPTDVRGHGSSDVVRYNMLISYSGPHFNRHNERLRTLRLYAAPKPSHCQFCVAERDNGGPLYHPSGSRFPESPAG